MECISAEAAVARTLVEVVAAVDSILVAAEAEAVVAGTAAEAVVAAADIVKITLRCKHA